MTKSKMSDCSRSVWNDDFSSCCDSTTTEPPGSCLIRYTSAVPLYRAAWTLGCWLASCFQSISIRWFGHSKTFLLLWLYNVCVIIIIFVQTTLRWASVHGWIRWYFPAVTSYSSFDLKRFGNVLFLLALLCWHYRTPCILHTVQQGVGVTAYTKLLSASHHLLEPPETWIIHATTVQIPSCIKYWTKKTRHEVLKATPPWSIFISLVRLLFPSLLPDRNEHPR